MAGVPVVADVVSRMAHTVVIWHDGQSCRAKLNVRVLPCLSLGSHKTVERKCVTRDFYYSPTHTAILNDCIVSRSSFGPQCGCSSEGAVSACIHEPKGRRHVAPARHSPAGQSADFYLYLLCSLIVLI